MTRIREEEDRVLRKSAGDCMANANKSPKILQQSESGKMIRNMYPGLDHH